MLTNLSELQQCLIAAFQNYEVAEIAEAIMIAAEVVNKEKRSSGLDNAASDLLYLIRCIQKYAE